MGLEDGFDVSKIAASPSMEGPVRKSLPEVRQEDAEQVAKRVSRLKNWLHNSVDVLGQAGNKVASSAIYSGKDLAINNYWMSVVPHDTATTILLGLATGAKLGSYATHALLAIQDELQDPQGRYIRELKRIKRELPPGDPDLGDQRNQHIATARHQYYQAKQQEEALIVDPVRWGDSGEITSNDINERRQELARQSELGYLERALSTRDVPHLTEESVSQVPQSVPDLFPTMEGEVEHE